MNLAKHCLIWLWWIWEMQEQWGTDPGNLSDERNKLRDTWFHWNWKGRESLMDPGLEPRSVYSQIQIMPCWTNPAPGTVGASHRETSSKLQRQVALWSSRSDEVTRFDVSFLTITDHPSRRFAGGEYHFSSLSGKGRAVHPNKFSILTCELWFTVTRGTHRSPVG